MILGNMAFVFFLIFSKGFKSLFLGTLRDVEVEHLMDKIWMTMMDSLLIMTIFRDEFTAQFVAFFVFLLFMKTFHWLSQDRVDYLQQTPQVTTLTHLRIVSLMKLMAIVDVSFVYYAINYSLALRGPSIMILFGFEYLLLISSIFCTMGKYVLSLIDMKYDGRWEKKGAYVLYLEFFVETIRLVVYVAFFGIILAYYGIPLHIVRQLYFTFASFRRRAAEVIRYRKATTNMDARFPNATPQELAQAETCIVCREELDEGKKLPCEHILHLHCLRSWLERQQVCPICRTPVLQEDIPAQPPHPPAHPPVPQWNAPNRQWNVPNVPPAPGVPHAPQPRGDDSGSPPSVRSSPGDTLQQIQLLQQQMVAVQQQLMAMGQQLQHLHAQLRHSYESQQGLQPDDGDDELLRRVLAESLQTSERGTLEGKQEDQEPQQTESPDERSNSRESKEEEEEEPNEKEQLRRRRLQRFTS